MVVSSGNFNNAGVAVGGSGVAFGSGPVQSNSFARSADKSTFGETNGIGASPTTVNRSLPNQQQSSPIVGAGEQGVLTTCCTDSGSTMCALAKKENGKTLIKATAEGNNRPCDSGWKEWGPTGGASYADCSGGPYGGRPYSSATIDVGTGLLIINGNENGCTNSVFYGNLSGDTACWANENVAEVSTGEFTVTTINNA
jgi:hypothetical protein